MKQTDATTVSDAQLTNPGPTANVLPLESYPARALEWVKSQRSVDGLQLEIVGKPALKPETFRWKMAPDAIVLVNLNSGAIVQDQALVMFSNNRPAGTAFIGKPLSGATRIERNCNKLEKNWSLFATAMDVSRVRSFYPYLPDDIRSMLKHPIGARCISSGSGGPSWREVSRTCSDTCARRPEWVERETLDDELRRFAVLQPMPWFKNRFFYLRI
jgi:hypothetical protein